MRVRHYLLATTAVAGFSVLTALPAQAGLLGSGKSAHPSFEYVVGGVGGVEFQLFNNTTAPVALLSAVTYQQGAQSGSIVEIEDTKVTITNPSYGFLTG